MFFLKSRRFLSVAIPSVFALATFSSFASNYYVTSKEGDAILSDWEECYKDKSMKSASIPSWNQFPSVAIIGCWKKDKDGNADVVWFSSVGSGGEVITSPLREKIELPKE